MLHVIYRHKLGLYIIIIIKSLLCSKAVIFMNSLSYSCLQLRQNAFSYWLAQLMKHSIGKKWPIVIKGLNNSLLKAKTTVLEPLNNTFPKSFLLQAINTLCI